jgi:purine-nucleoside phosphorylase
MRCIVTALKSEANPIIEYLKLTKESRDIYSNHDTKVIISGIGKINSAIAVTRVRPTEKVINIGLCGSTHHEIGSIFQIKKIIDRSSQKVVHLKREGETLTCVDTAQNDPTLFDKTLVDMESYGFYIAAKKFVKKENIELYKIVSDKISDTILSPKEVDKLIYPHLKMIL